MASKSYYKHLGLKTFDGISDKKYVFYVHFNNSRIDATRMGCVSIPTKLDRFGMPTLQYDKMKFFIEYWKAVLEEFLIEFEIREDELHKIIKIEAANFFKIQEGNI